MNGGPNLGFQGTLLVPYLTAKKKSGMNLDEDWFYEDITNKSEEVKYWDIVYQFISVFVFIAKNLRYFLVPQFSELIFGKHRPTNIWTEAHVLQEIACPRAPSRGLCNLSRSKLEICGLEVSLTCLPCTFIRLTTAMKHNKCHETTFLISACIHLTFFSL